MPHRRPTGDVVTHTAPPTTHPKARRRVRPPLSASQPGRPRRNRPARPRPSRPPPRLQSRLPRPAPSRADEIREAGLDCAGNRPHHATRAPNPWRRSPLSGQQPHSNNGDRRHSSGAHDLVAHEVDPIRPHKVVKDDNRRVDRTSPRTDLADRCAFGIPSKLPKSLVGDQAMLRRKTAVPGSRLDGERKGDRPAVPTAGHASDLDPVQGLFTPRDSVSDPTELSHLARGGKHGNRNLHAEIVAKPGPASAARNRQRALSCTNARHDSKHDTGEVHRPAPV